MIPIDDRLFAIQPQNKLLSLPAEIRVLIYGALFSPNLIALASFFAPDRPPCRLSLLLTCRQIYAEAHAIAYRNSVFHLAAAPEVLCGLPPPPPHPLAAFLSAARRYLSCRRPQITPRDCFETYGYLEEAARYAASLLPASFTAQFTHLRLAINPDCCRERSVSIAPRLALAPVSEVFSSATHVSARAAWLGQTGPETVALLREFPRLRRLAFVRPAWTHGPTQLGPRGVTRCLILALGRASQNGELAVDHVKHANRAGCACVGLRNLRDGKKEVRHVWVVVGYAENVREVLAVEWKNSCPEGETNIFAGFDRGSAFAARYAWEIP